MKAVPLINYNNIRLPTTVYQLYWTEKIDFGILMFFRRPNFILSWVEHEKVLQPQAL